MPSTDYTIRTLNKSDLDEVFELTQIDGWMLTYPVLLDLYVTDTNGFLGAYGASGELLGKVQSCTFHYFLLI